MKVLATHFLQEKGHILHTSVNIKYKSLQDIFPSKLTPFGMQTTLTVFNVHIYACVHSFNFLSFMQFQNFNIYNTDASIASSFLARLARSCTKSCTYLASLALKMKLFLQDKKSCNNLARKNCKKFFLQDFDQILQ